MQVGSDVHKVLFCREFVDTHVSYDPSNLEWPVLDDDTLGRLRALPFWSEAVATERDVAQKVQALAPLERDDLIREAIALQGYEEGRHSALIQEMTAHYGLPVREQPPEERPADIEWAFIRTGYGECFDSFFAFGLFRLARDSGFFPRALVAFFEPIVQEEARHILFFVNWVAYRRARKPLSQRPADIGRCALAMAAQMWRRVKTARGVDSDEFMLKGGASFDFEISPRGFLEVCLEENERRLAPYDPRLLRPRFVPALARAAKRFLRR